ncbi:MAG TPA: IS1634 family transposase [Longimicrobiales bacterium]|nr:IS1634 family transposase [Longimicrobiales bacterium]
MFIDIVPNRSSPPAVLLREAWREGKRIRKRTLANLSALTPEQIEGMRRILRGETLVPAGEAFVIERSLPHGHVVAALGTLRHLELERVLASRPSRERSMCVAMIVARLLDPASKLATARGLGETAFTTLGEEAGVGGADADALYEALDWLLARQDRIERKLAQRHLHDGALVLYDVTSTYFEGRSCPLARRGYSRDGKKDKLQIVVGLVCNAEGCPVAVEVFPGNTADPATLTSAVEKVRARFGLERVVLVADRGLITSARIREELLPASLDWITALRAPQIKTLVESGSLQLSIFDEQDLCEITSEDFPGERLIACRNPLLAAERARKREDLLAATELELEKVAQAAARERMPLRGAHAIGIRVGRVLGRFKVGKHFRYQISDHAFTFERDLEAIRAEAALDGLYVIRTSVSRNALPAAGTVEAYKNLAQVERAFRSHKTVDLHVRPIYHRREDRVRAHVLLCMLAYYVEWHMRRQLAPILFDDDDRATARALRSSIVAPAQRSPSALRKVRSKHTAEGEPVHSFRTLLKDLSTLTRNRVRVGSVTFDQMSAPTTLQRRAFDLLQARPQL